MSPVVESQLTYLSHYPMMVAPFFRVINHKNGYVNIREDNFHKKRNADFQVMLLDIQRKPLMKFTTVEEMRPDAQAKQLWQ